MPRLPRAAQVFWLSVVCSGTFVAINILLDARPRPMDWVAVALFGAAGTVAYAFRVYRPLARERHGEWVSVAMAVNVAATMALPVPAVIAVVIFENVLQPLFARRVDWHKRAFNLAQVVLSVAAAGTIWHTFGGDTGVIETASDVGWMLVALMAYFSINFGSVVVMYALVERLSLQYVWRRGYGRLMPSVYAVMSAGVLGAHLWSTVPSSVLLLVIPLIAIYLSFTQKVELEEQTVEALFNLADMLDKRDYYTHRHSLRVGEYAERLATHLRLSAEEGLLLYLCGRLHDIGKCAVDNEVLLKAGPLTEDELHHIRRHAEVGGAMLAHFSTFKTGASYVRGHHERWDGAGYPDGLRGEAIPFGARLIAVVDAYDAMTSTRPYRLALPHDEAIRRLREGAGSQWDPRLVRAFLDMWERKPAGVPSPADVAVRPGEGALREGALPAPPGRDHANA